MGPMKRIFYQQRSIEYDWSLLIVGGSSFYPYTESSLTRTASSD